MDNLIRYSFVIVYSFNGQWQYNEQFILGKSGTTLEQVYNNRLYGVIYMALRDVTNVWPYLMNTRR